MDMAYLQQLRHGATWRNTAGNTCADYSIQWQKQGQLTLFFTTKQAILETNRHGRSDAVRVAETRKSKNKEEEQYEDQLYLGT